LLNGSESTKEVEVIKEVIKYVEVPVVEEKEVIKIEYVEVEKIVEVIKEVPVTNLDNICDKTYVDELLKKIEELENQPPKVVEVVVEKEGDDSSLKPKLEALQNTLMKIRQENIEKDKKILEYEKTIEDIQRLQENKQAVYLNGSNLSNKLNN
jgi:vacuolar-type H+-ATPase subunit I/STV1